MYPQFANFRLFILLFTPTKNSTIMKLTHHPGDLICKFIFYVQAIHVVAK